MAEATNFDESNFVLDKPKDMSYDECSPLCISKGYTEFEGKLIPTIISCWKLTKEELEEVNETKKIWLMIVGESMPPVTILGCKPTFKSS